MIFMYKIGVVGEKDSIIAFLALGITIMPVETSHDAEMAINKMAKDGYGIIFVTETIAKDIKETIDMYKNEMLPAVILIPGSQGSLGIGLGRIKDNVEKAVGVDILSKKER